MSAVTRWGFPAIEPPCQTRRYPASFHFLVNGLSSEIGLNQRSNPRVLFRAVRLQDEGVCPIGLKRSCHRDLHNFRTETSAQLHGGVPTVSRVSFQVKLQGFVGVLADEPGYIRSRVCAAKPGADIAEEVFVVKVWG